MHRVFVLALLVCAFPIATHAAEPCVRYATQTDVDALAGQIQVGACIDQATEALVTAKRPVEAIAYLSTKICGSRQAGLPAGFNPTNTNSGAWVPIKEGYVYFQAGQAAMNPGALSCFKTFFEQAEARGMQPCISAALRAPAHQLASCLDPGNRTVCGRSNRGTGSANSCSPSPASYANCPHVNGLAMDINDKRCGGSSCLYTYQVLNLAKQSGIFSKVGAGSSDPWHVEAARCADPNFRPTQNYGGNNIPSNGLADAVRTAITGQSGQCQQMQQQCYAGNSGACTAFAYQCQGQTPQQAQPPRAPSSPTGGSNSGTSGIGDAFTPPVITIPTTTPATTTASTTTTGDSILDTIVSITVGSTTQGTSTPQNPLSPTTVIQLAQNQTTLQPETPTALPPNTVATQQTFFTGNPTFGEGNFISTEDQFGETHALPTTGFARQLADIRTFLETILAYIQPFSPARYATASGNGAAPDIDNEYANFLETTDDPASLFDDGFDFSAFDQ